MTHEIAIVQVKVDIVARVLLPACSWARVRLLIVVVLRSYYSIQRFSLQNRFNALSSDPPNLYSVDWCTFAFVLWLDCCKKKKCSRWSNYVFSTSNLFVTAKIVLDLVSCKSQNLKGTFVNKELLMGSVSWVPSVLLFLLGFLFRGSTAADTNTTTVSGKTIRTSMNTAALFNSHTS